MSKTTIAIMYDFDKTLSQKDMQEFKFIPDLGISSQQFWGESTKLAQEENMDSVLAYMYLMIKISRSYSKPVLRKHFVELGRSIEYFSGVKTWFKNINDYATKKGAVIKHYIISSGLKEIIEGTSIYNNFDKVYACEFHYDENGVADWPKLAVNYTGKTQFLYRVNKQVLDISNDNDLNKFTPEVDRPIPFRNMVYIGDGYTDIPCMKLVKSNGGHSIAVYRDESKLISDSLINDGRVDYAFLADYSKTSHLYKTVCKLVDSIVANDILIKLNRKQVLELQSEDDDV